MKKIKILFLCKYFPPVPGGIELASKKIVEFSHSKFDIKILAFKKRKQNCITQESLNLCSSFELFRQPLSLSYFFKSIRNSHRADIIYIHYPNILCVFITKLVKLMRPEIKIIVHYHADFVTKSFWLDRFYSNVTKSLLKLSNGIIVTSKNYITGSKHLTEFIDKIKVIQLSTSEIKAKAPFAHVKNKSIIFIGRLVSYKGILEFSNYIDMIDYDATINIVGTGPLSSVLASRISLLKSKNRVRLLGHVDNAELSKLLRKADLLILPSITRAEAFGLVMLEAQSLGVPSVCFNIPGSGVSEVNRHKITGYVAKMNDYEQYIYYINKILLEKPFEKKELISYHKMYYSDIVIKEKWIKYINNISL